MWKDILGEEQDKKKSREIQMEFCRAERINVSSQSTHSLVADHNSNGQNPQMDQTLTQPTTTNPTFIYKYELQMLNVMFYNQPSGPG